MKILHVLDHSVPIQSGYSFRTLSILREQQARGWETCHLTGVRQWEAPESTDFEQGQRFSRTDKAFGQGIPLLEYVGSVVAMRREIARMISTERPDVIHAHSPSLNAMAAFGPAKAAGLPVVYEVRAFWEDAGVDHGTVREDGIRYRLIRALETSAMRKAACVTTICNGLRNDIVERKGITDAKVTVIPNAVDVEKFAVSSPCVSQLRERYSLANSPVIGFVGSFYAYEGLDLLISAMRGVLKKRPDAKLVLVGGHEQEEALRRQVTELGLDETVVFTGRVPNEQVTDYYDLIDILAYPRRSMRLTELVTPLKPLEALAMGKLLVLSDVGGHREIAASLYEAASFPAGNVEALSSKLLERIAELPDSSVTVRAGRDYIENERNWRVVVARYEAVYSQALEQVRR